jgi:hypothetical protein
VHTRGGPFLGIMGVIVVDRMKRVVVILERQLEIQ